MSKRIGGEFKIKAIKSFDNMYSVGDEFIFKDGWTVWNDGMSSNRYTNFSEFLKINPILMEDFVLVYEKPCTDIVRELVNKVKEYENAEKEKK